MNKEFIPYDLAKELVELGFDEKCFDVYSDVKSRLWHMPRKRTPKILWQQAFRFFRDNHDLNAYIERYEDKTFTYTITGDRFTEEVALDEVIWYVYEDAMIACIKKLIELVKQN